jgi:hypothetical protein
MKLRRISRQQPETVAEFYYRLKSEQSDSGSARFQAMIDLIGYLEMQNPEHEYWVYTSEESLVFTKSDHMGLGVGVEPVMGAFVITYPLPPEKAPWEGALIEGVTPDVVEAAHMVRVALEHANAS